MVQVQSLQDGSLFVVSPKQETRFDMGNAQLFASFNGSGDVARLLLPAGIDLGDWRVQLRLNEQLLDFREAQAIGRLWTLRGRCARCTYTLISCMASNDPAVYQLLNVENHSGERLSLQVTIDLNAASSQEAEPPFATTKQPDFWRLWAQGGAKAAKPQPARLCVLQGGTVEFRSREHFAWVASQPPAHVAQDARSVTLRYDLTLDAGSSAQLAWGVRKSADGEADPHPWREALSQAEAYAKWLQATAVHSDPLLRALMVSGLNAALSMYKEFPDNFCGLLAGPDYAYPPRLYFRDGYWTAQILLLTRPELVRRHLLSLARGVHADGACPSGVFAPHLLEESSLPLEEQQGRLDWLPDHIDSPALFVLLLYDYVSLTEDLNVLHEAVPNRPQKMWEIAWAALQHLLRRSPNGLLEKPYAPNDWADNVRRSRWVTYDQALLVAALCAGGALAAWLGDFAHAAHFRSAARDACAALNRRLWLPQVGHFANYMRPEYTEAHFSIDALLTLYFRLVDEEKAASMVRAAKCLQTRRNAEQPFGDWGVMSVFPHYGEPRDLFGKSAQPYHYHNGADWPYWDGVYGAVLLEREDDDWRYALTRWWTYSLEQGWLTPVEYFSPPYPPGGMLQGWSSLPAAVLLRRQRPELAPLGAFTATCLGAS
ncbi:hypothetical protein [Caldilinea sp.]|uniref:hypothetical protein n=1 Tax=Caldilinea sp. TaxID=2293560 RepID=UPI0026029C2F|nr:hypothetical protein [Caldilinea sp.]